MDKQYAIELLDFRKSYGDKKVIDGIDILVQEGKIASIIGPNGAGKTTTIECMLGVKSMDSGRCSILGLNPIKDKKTLFSRVGVQFQSGKYQENIKVWEMCELMSAVYEAPIDYIPMLKEMGLYEHREKYVTKLSGGQEQRLSILIAMLNNPDVLFFDELTTGLDPMFRREVLDSIKGLKDKGKTILMTSHFMDEVEYLSDYIYVLGNREIILEGTKEDVLKSTECNSLNDMYIKLFKEVVKDEI